MNAMVPIPTSNAEVYRASTDAADLCKGIVVASAMTIQGRKYVKVEGWQAIAIAHGCTGSARDVERVDGGVRAIGEVRRMSDGAVIAEAEGFVGEDEPTWFGGKVGTKTLQKRPDYAIRAMAQTRAVSRACRSAFAHVVVMMNAGLSTTPAEEVPEGGFDDRKEPRNVSPRPQASGDDLPPAEERAISLLRVYADDADAFRETWEKNRDGWRKVMSHEAYARVVAVMKEIGGRFAAAKAEVPTAAPEPAQAANPYDISDDEIPF